MSVGHAGSVIVAAYGFSSSGGDTNLTRLYDIAKNTWSFGAPAPGPVSSEGIAVSAAGKVYALGGRGGAGHDNNRYTFATNTWTSLAPMPTARDGLGAAFVEGQIFAIGGRPETAGPCTGRGQEFATVERYDIRTNTWKTVTPLPHARSDVGAIAVWGRIFVFGGCANGVVSNEVDIYDPDTNKWTQGAPLPTARAAFYGIGREDTTIYVIGGITSTSSGASSANEAYDFKTNTWHTKAPMIHPRAEMGVVSVDDRIFTVGGGVPGFGTPVDTNDAFRP
jgi:N-acetylneuraminic acid mutarotase